MNNAIKILPATFLATAAVGMTQAAELKQPNIVLLFVDDMGWADMGYRNDAYYTPNLDRLAEEGIDYTRAYVPTATSSPSRAALLTGKESLRCGFVRHIYDNPNRDEFQSFAKDPGKMKSRGWLPLEEVTYAERLHDAGYYNYFVGKWHLGHEPYFPIHQGFDAMYGTCEHGHPGNYYAPFFKTMNPLPEAKEGDYLMETIGQGAVDFISNYKTDQPFLLNVWFYGVHGRRIANKKYVDKYLAAGADETTATYASMLETLDVVVGDIRAALKERGLDENTIIVFSSDQGGALKNGNLRGGKSGGDALAEGGSRVPFIVYDPNSPMLGEKYTEPISTIDVYPTFVELATGKKCKDKVVRGVSLVPTFAGKSLKQRDLFLHRSYEDQNSAIVNGDWKLIKYRSGKIELYNIADDESETTNLAEKYPELSEKMLDRLIKWQAEATPEYLLPEEGIIYTKK